MQILIASGRRPHAATTQARSGGNWGPEMAPGGVGTLTGTSGFVLCPNSIKLLGFALSWRRTVDPVVAGSSPVALVNESSHRSRTCGYCRFGPSARFLRVCPPVCPQKLLFLATERLAISDRFCLPFYIWNPPQPPSRLICSLRLPLRLPPTMFPTTSRSDPASACRTRSVSCALAGQEAGGGDASWPPIVFVCQPGSVLFRAAISRAGNVFSWASPRTARASNRPWLTGGLPGPVVTELPICGRSLTC
jgi:hypothetical protein